MNIDGMASTGIPTLDREKFGDVRDQTRLVKSLLIVVSFVTQPISDFSFENLLMMDRILPCCPLSVLPIAMKWILYYPLLFLSLYSPYS